MLKPEGERLLSFGLESQGNRKHRPSSLVAEPSKQPDVPTYVHGDSVKHSRKKVKSLKLLRNRNFGREYAVGTVMEI
jgi:hypothetical protein